MWLSVKIKQQSKSDCGAASLASVAAHYGMRVPLSKIRLYSGTDSGGATLKGLVEAARRFGFLADGFKGERESLDKIPKPAIIHLKKDDGYLHYVVLTKSSASCFHIMDPLDGEIQRVPRETLLREWTGYLILLSPSVESKKLNFKEGTQISLLQWIKGLLAKRWMVLSGGIILSVLHLVSSLAVAIFIKYLLDDIIPSGGGDQLTKVSLLMALILLLSILISVTRSIMNINLSIETDRELITNYLRHLFRIPLPFFNTIKTGELTSRIYDIYRIRNLISETLPEAVIAFITLFVSLALLFLTESKLALLCLAFIPLYLTIYIIHDRLNKPLMRCSMERASRFQSVIIESLRSVSTIKNFSNERFAMARTSLKLEELNNTLSQTGKVSIYAGAAAEMVSKFIMLLILWSGGGAVIAGILTIGELISFYTIAALFTAPLQQIAFAISSVREGNVAATRYLDIMALEEECSGNGERVRADNLVVSNLSYSYPGRERLFENISFEIGQGKILLLRGESGCGKSTIAAILMLHMRPESGTVKVNGKNIFDFDPVGWRGSVSIVPQNPDLFGNTIKECIMDGVESNNHREIYEELCVELELNKIFESLPNGDATHPGEGGSLLSRGEQQRIAFARAVARKPSFLILDEATSSMDIRSEKIIERAIMKLKREGTLILIISHKSRSCLIADEIIDMR